MGQRDVRFYIHFDGPVMMTDRATAFDFGPALEALTQLITTGFALLRPQRPAVTVRTEPEASPGAFTFTVSETGPGPGWLARWLKGPVDYGHDSLKSVLSDLGLLTSGHGLIPLVKWLQGRQPASQTPKSPDQVIFGVMQDGWPDRLSVSTGTARLYGRPDIHRLLAAVLQPVVWDGVQLCVIARGVSVQISLLRNDVLLYLGLPPEPVISQEGRPDDADPSKPPSGAQASSGARGAAAVSEPGPEPRTTEEAAPAEPVQEAVAPPILVEAEKCKG